MPYQVNKEGVGPRLFHILPEIAARAAKCGRVHHHDEASSCQMPITSVFSDAPFPVASLTVRRLSERTTVRTCSIMSSLREVDGRPDRGSLSHDSCPSLNRRNYSNTRARLMASSPNANFIISLVSVAVFPSLKQNFMQIRCSTLSVIFALRLTTCYHLAVRAHCHLAATRSMMRFCLRQA